MLTSIRSAPTKDDNGLSADVYSSSQHRRKPMLAAWQICIDAGFNCVAKVLQRRVCVWSLQRWSSCSLIGRDGKTKNNSVNLTHPFHI